MQQPSPDLLSVSQARGALAHYPCDHIPILSEGSPLPSSSLLRCGNSPLTNLQLHPLIAAVNYKLPKSTMYF